MQATGYELALSKVGSDVVMLCRSTKRMVDGEAFIYEGLEKEKVRQQEYNKKIAGML